MNKEVRYASKAKGLSRAITRINIKRYCSQAGASKLNHPIFTYMRGVGLQTDIFRGICWTSGVGWSPVHAKQVGLWSVKNKS